MPFDDYRKIDAYSKRYSNRKDEIQKLYEYRQIITDEMKNKGSQTDESMFKEPKEVKEIKLDLIDQTKDFDKLVRYKELPKKRCTNTDLKEKILKRYNKNPIEDPSLMTQTELKIYEFLTKVSISDKELKLPIQEQNKVSGVITVYKQYKPQIEKFYKENCKNTQDVQTQTNEVKSYLLPLYQTRVVKKDKHIDDRLSEQTSAPQYKAYNLKNCPYVRVYKKNH